MFNRLVGVLALIVVGAVVCSVSAQSFSVNQISPAVNVSGLQADDVFVSLGPLPAPVLSPPAVGFNGAGVNLEVDAFSFGRPINHFGLNQAAVFSVDIGSRGVAGSPAAVEFNAPNGSENSSDLYLSTYNNTHTLFRDGDGAATGVNPAVQALGVAEPATFFPPVGPLPASGVGDVDAVDLRVNQLVPAMSPTGAVYFSVDQNTTASGVYGPGRSGADIFTALGTSGYDTPPAVNTSPTIYAAETMLGLGQITGNDLDALVVYDDGDGQFVQGQDIIVFSLAAGSPYLGTVDPVSGLAINEGDVLIDGMSAQLLLGAVAPNAAVLHSAESLGLQTVRTHLVAGNDNLNALDLVPEPSVMGLILAAGVLGLAHRRRRAA